MCRSSRVKNFISMAKLDEDVFVTLPLPRLCPSEGHKLNMTSPYTEFIMADRSGKPRYECMKTRRVRI